MALKLKALGLGLIATLAIGASLAMNAPAETGGHFTSEVAHTIIKGEQVAINEYIDSELGIVFSCKKATFEGTINAATVTEFRLTPTYQECFSGLGIGHVTMNGCEYLFTIGKNSVRHNTVHLVCPEGQKVEIHQTSTFGTCTLTYKPQTFGNGVAYTTGGVGATHDLLLDITFNEIHVERHGGPCVIIPTTGTKVELRGTVTLKGFNTEGKQIGITATGSEG